MVDGQFLIEKKKRVPEIKARNWGEKINGSLLSVWVKGNNTKQDTERTKR